MNATAEVQFPIPVVPEGFDCAVLYLRMLLRSMAIIIKLFSRGAACYPYQKCLALICRCEFDVGFSVWSFAF